MSTLFINIINTHEEFKILSGRLRQSLYNPELLKWCDHSLPDETLWMHTVFVMKDDHPVAGISLYKNDQIHYRGNPVLIAGQYECIPDDETAAFLLNEITQTASRLGYDFIIGPMNGNTWNTYRFAENWKNPLFFSEVYHHPYYSEQWIKNGYSIVESYFSSRQDELFYDENFILAKRKEFENNGIFIRQINILNPEEDFRKIYQLAVKAFSQNVFYSPISEDQFVHKYMELKKFMNPDIIWIADDGKKICGFNFCLNNFADPGRKGLIVKTIARDINDPRTKGLGTLFSSLSTKYCKENNLGYQLHAFMHDENASVKLSENFAGNILRRYNLYIKACR